MNDHDKKSKCPSFRFPNGCPSIYPRHSNHKVVLVSDSISGLIQQTGTTSVEYWRYVGLQAPSGTITITNTGFTPMTIYVAIKELGKIERSFVLFCLDENGQSRSATVHDLVSLRVASTENGTCVGRYCLTIHYSKEIV
jgi:hypothetical protein